MNAVSLNKQEQKKRVLQLSKSQIKTTNKNLVINTLIPKFKFKNNKGEVIDPKNNILL